MWPSRTTSAVWFKDTSKLSYLYWEIVLVIRVTLPGHTTEIVCWQYHLRASWPHTFCLANWMTRIVGGGTSSHGSEAPYCGIRIKNIQVLGLQFELDQPNVPVCKHLDVASHETWCDHIHQFSEYLRLSVQAKGNTLIWKKSWLKLNYSELPEPRGTWQYALSKSNLNQLSW